MGAKLIIYALSEQKYALNIMNFNRALKYDCFITNGLKLTVSLGIQYGSMPFTKTEQKQKIKV
jgi:hypothetical protein